MPTPDEVAAALERLARLASETLWDVYECADEDMPNAIALAAMRYDHATVAANYPRLLAERDRLREAALAVLAGQRLDRTIECGCEVTAGTLDRLRAALGVQP